MSRKSQETIGPNVDIRATTEFEEVALISITSSLSTAKEADMDSKQKTVIVTGGSQGIGAGIVRSFLDHGYSVVANSRNITKVDTFTKSGHLALVDGSIGESAVASKVVETAVQKFGSVDALVNNAGIFFTKSFTDYTVEDFKALSSTNLEGFLYVTQGVVKQMLAQKSGGSVVTITASLVDNPIAGIPASVPMITKGGLEAVTLSLATEFAKEKIRFNAVAPGVVDTPLHKNNPKDFLKTLSPMGTICDVKDIVEAVVYLTEARYVTGEVLHVDGGAHSGKW
jgi:NAD(P)-dependent dehydrogenase (short-subunit alcohol dehydrogenase family)